MENDQIVTLNFKGRQLEALPQNGGFWFSLLQIAGVLGYGSPKGLEALYQRKRASFQPEDVQMMGDPRGGPARIMFSNSGVCRCCIISGRPQAEPLYNFMIDLAVGRVRYPARPVQLMLPGAFSPLSEISLTLNEVIAELDADNPAVSLLRQFLDGTRRHRPDPILRHAAGLWISGADKKGVGAREQNEAVRIVRAAGFSKEALVSEAARIRAEKDEEGSDDAA